MVFIYVRSGGEKTLILAREGSLGKKSVRQQGSFANLNHLKSYKIIKKVI